MAQDGSALGGDVLGHQGKKGGECVNVPKQNCEIKHMALRMELQSIGRCAKQLYCQVTLDASTQVLSGECKLNKREESVRVRARKTEEIRAKRNKAKFEKRKRDFVKHDETEWDICTTGRRQSRGADVIRCWRMCRRTQSHRKEWTRRGKNEKGIGKADSRCSWRMAGRGRIRS